MASSKRDNARDQAGDVGKANGYQRQDSTAVDLFPESLPEPVAAHHPHVTATGEAQRQRIIEMLRPGQKHTLDFRRAGIMQSQTRIFELRAQGYPHRGVAVYALVAEAVQEVAP